MIRIRRLELQDETGVWHPEAYIIENDAGGIELRYPLSWDVIGSKYYGAIQASGLPMEQVEQILSGTRLRWLPVETVAFDFEQATELLDPQFHIPRLKKKIAAPA